MTSYRTPDGVIVPTEDVVYQNGTNRPMWFDGHRNVLLTEEDDSTTNKSLVPRMPFAVPNRRTSYTAQQLMDADFPEPKWAVPGLIAEGLTFIAGAPKVGKSWLALGLGIAVASGGQVLGNIPVDEGEVLYLALEDNPRRLKDRIGRVLKGASVPSGLHFELEWPALTAGGDDQLDDWLSQHPECRLVMVDVFARVRNPAAATDRYLGDYQAAVTLKSIADTHAVAVLCNHHTRKAGAEDFLDTMSGTQGLAGAADSIVVLKRGRGQADAELDITGRDIEERQLALRFDADVGTWVLLGDAGEWAISASRRRVLEVLRSEGPLMPKEVGELVDLSRDTAKMTLSRMSRAGQVVSNGAGTYSAPSQEASPLTPVTAVTGVSDKPPTSTNAPNLPVTGGGVTGVTGKPPKDWTYGHTLEPCEVCQEPCEARTLDGRVIHPSCPVEEVS